MARSASHSLKLRIAITVIATALSADAVLADPFPVASHALTAMSKVTVCFTPGEPCDDLVVEQIAAAKKSILVQAFNFTNEKILRALVAAKNRGVKVQVLLAKKHEVNRSEVLTTLLAAGVPVKIDDKVRAAHNKVIIFDAQAVVTGSYNFTNAAQRKNSENLLLLRESPALVAAYVKNWEFSSARSRAPALDN
jgi:phosphatidylserine/phosphatidylglycerophosphate/cardiolipin synthase-like enzyme